MLLDAFSKFNVSEMKTVRNPRAVITAASRFTMCLPSILDSDYFQLVGRAKTQTSQLDDFIIMNIKNNYEQPGNHSNCTNMASGLARPTDICLLAADHSSVVALNFKTAQLKVPLANWPPIRKKARRSVCATLVVRISFSGSL